MACQQICRWYVPLESLNNKLTESFLAELARTVEARRTRYNRKPGRDYFVVTFSLWNLKLSFFFGVTIQNNTNDIGATNVGMSHRYTKMCH